MNTRTYTPKMAKPQSGKGKRRQNATQRRLRAREQAAFEAGVGAAGLTVARATQRHLARFYVVGLFAVGSVGFAAGVALGRLWWE